MSSPSATPDNKNHQDMAAMFNSIAATYDMVNRGSSFGLDSYWRNRLIRALRSTGARLVLDIACGTGVLSWSIYRRLDIEVTGLDLSANMLEEAEKKRPRFAKGRAKEPVFIEGKAEQLPFSDQMFDAITIAFGVRNFADRPAAFRQAFRVLKPGGHLFILEFASPKNVLWKFLFRSYFLYILPLFGQAVSGNKKAYRYLPRSVTHFPQYEALCTELAEAGFSAAGYRSYTGGVAVLYKGEKAGCT